ncbi:bifunctional 4-hydroxy-2-oxoglutarate aldolase/2-dehydro-3-deoxy-phosphogluconate aldolase [Catenulispora pinisilvae]|uniref:bifunctional 4-hydroxy-2-oxoglutarate aldolase/2-dehydro-3-deoxy-phosphogluconate aldolase n=1 Tax=Catenulispora pinisilvae TaxID=2705253 RepID=UPI001891E94D|nr:bifunctional 4-hydroxy-2-oxoglutarate aldolase/2-dehydro-3-deoxy-phosphogluconate aldolase [Catenulispora pinisilvae]
MTGSHPVPQDVFDEMFRHSPVLAILRGLDQPTTLDLCHRLWDLGVVAVEIPVQRERDLATLAAAATAGKHRRRLVGAGTVTSVELVAQVAAAGAAFTVAPGLDEHVLTACTGLGLAHLPGVATGTEVQHATRLRLRWLKAFPAAQLGSAWITAMLAPFPDARFVATGGITTGNAGAFLAAGAAAVSLGASLADADDDAIQTLIARASPTPGGAAGHGRPTAWTEN